MAGDAVRCRACPPHRMPQSGSDGRRVRGADCLAGRESTRAFQTGVHLRAAVRSRVVPAGTRREPGRRSSLFRLIVPLGGAAWPCCEPPFVVVDFGAADACGATVLLGSTSGGGSGDDGATGAAWPSETERPNRRYCRSKSAASTSAAPSIGKPPFQRRAEEAPAGTQPPGARPDTEHRACLGPRRGEHAPVRFPPQPCHPLAPA